MANGLWTTCTVNGVQAATDGTEVGAGTPQVYVNLTDQGGTFVSQDFFLASPGQNQMLAVALAAMNAGLSVGIGYTAPNIPPGTNPPTGGNPYTGITRIIAWATPQP